MDGWIWVGEYVAAGVGEEEERRGDRKEEEPTLFFPLRLRVEVAACMG